MSFQVLVKCQEVYCRKTCPMPLNISTTGGNKLVITQIAEEGIRDIHVPYASAAVLPGPTSSVDEDIYREPVIVQTPSPCLLQSYEDVGQAAFGDSGRAFITAVLYTELIGTCALFFILEASHLLLAQVYCLGRRYLFLTRTFKLGCPSSVSSLGKSHNLDQTSPCDLDVLLTSMQLLFSGHGRCRRNLLLLLASLGVESRQG